MVYICSTIPDKKEYVMLEKQLLTELALAERNSTHELRYNRLRYANEVSNVFTMINVTTYFDLIRTDAKRALELRKLAKRENLI